MSILFINGSPNKNGNMCDLKEIGVDEISLQNGNDAYSPHSPKIFYMEDLS